MYESMASESHFTLRFQFSVPGGPRKSHRDHSTPIGGKRCTGDYDSTIQPGKKGIITDPIEVRGWGYWNGCNLEWVPKLLWMWESWNNCWIDFDMVLDICNYLHDRIFKGTKNTRNAIDRMHIYYKTSKYGQLDHSFLARTWRPRSSKLLGEAAKVWWNSCDLCYLIWLVIWNILYCCFIYLE